VNDCDWSNDVICFPLLNDRNQSVPPFQSANNGLLPFLEYGDRVMQPGLNPVRGAQVPWDKDKIFGQKLRIY
jgi:hypothetical protein